MTRFLAFFATAALLAACAATHTQPPGVPNPSNPDAPEGARVPRQTSLRADDTTRKSHALLTSAKNEQEKWDAYGPVSGTPQDPAKAEAKPETKHEHH